jgi:signal transduction histidine kinase
VSAADLERSRRDLQLRLARRLAAAATLLGAVLLALRWDRGTAVRWPGLFLLGIFAWVWYHHARGRVLPAFAPVALALGLGLARIFWALHWEGEGLPPALELVVAGGLLFHLCYGPGAAWVAYGMGVAALAVVAFGRPVDWRGLGRLADLFLVSTALQIAAWTYGRVFSLLWLEAGHRRRLLERERLLRRGLTQALLERLEAPLRSEVGDAAAERARVQALGEGLREARALRLAMAPSEAFDVDVSISRRLLPPLLGLGLVLMLLVSLRDLSLAAHDTWVSLVLSGVLAVLCGLLWLGRARWDRVAAVALLAGAAGLTASCALEQPGVLPDALTYGSVLVVFAALWLGRLSTLGVLLLLALLDLWAWGGRGAALSPGEGLWAVHHLFQWTLLAAVLMPAMGWRQELLRHLEAQRRELATGLRLRRRLLGTLYHDAANLVSAMQGLVALELEDGLAERYARLRRRLADLIASARVWLFEEGAFRREQLGVHGLRSLAMGLDDVFRERLAAKGLTLEVDIPDSLRVLCVPELLGEGVLGNLLSNAIKFSPPGGRVRLSAWLQEGKVCLSLRDQGRGYPKDLVERLEEGDEALPSRLGTDGEPGQGLGLVLAAEHLRRMGGRLELTSAPGGGAEARIWLEAA